MIIKTTVSTRQEVEKEISLPYHCKTTGILTHYLRVESEERAFRIYANDPMFSIHVLSTKYVDEDLATGTPITEAEFMEVYDKAMEKIQVCLTA